MNELVPVKVKKIKDPLKELKKRYGSLLRLVNNNDLIFCEQLNKINMRLNALDNKSKQMHDDLDFSRERIGQFYEIVNKSKIENSNYINQIKNNIIADTISYIREEINKNFVRKDKDFDRENAFTKFMEKVELLDDPLLVCLLKQAKFTYKIEDEEFCVITVLLKKCYEDIISFIIFSEDKFAPLMQEYAFKKYTIVFNYSFVL